MIFIRKNLAYLILPILLVIISFFFPYNYFQTYFLKQQAQEDVTTLHLIESSLNGYLKRFDPVPGLLARESALQNLFTLEANNPDTVTEINEHLKTITNDIGASDIYLLDKSGITIASSNFDTDYSFIGKDFSYRPYFEEAASGEISRFFALGTTSLKRGYYYSAPIYNNAEIVGVAAVKIDLEQIEKDWQYSHNEVIVVDNYGIVFMSSMPDWRYKSINELTPEVYEEIKQTRRYPIKELGSLNTHLTKSKTLDKTMLTIGENHTNSEPVKFLATKTAIKTADWSLYVLSPSSAANRLALTATLIVLLSILFLSSLVAFVIYRRRQFIQDLQRQEALKTELKNRVDERTKDLKTANKKLREEVSERKQTENALRKTQNELIQAGKLAALGQMSAALSHELNQPLAAIRTYAENAKELLLRKETDEVRQNISHISTMADRMTELGKHLRNFSRKPGTGVKSVNIQDVFHAVEIIMHGRVKDMNAVINISYEQQPMFVLAGEGRLQQVFVNILNNALDAMSSETAPIIDITVENTENGRTSIRFKDSGLGLPESEKTKIFDPFFTTKAANTGLGLGLSISYNVIQDFDGELSAENHPDGGAVFTVTLQTTEAEKVAAE